jgi:hypothetical protein
MSRHLGEVATTKVDETIVGDTSRECEPSAWPNLTTQDEGMRGPLAPHIREVPTMLTAEPPKMDPDDGINRKIEGTAKYRKSCEQISSLPRVRRRMDVTPAALDGGTLATRYPSKIS